MHRSYAVSFTSAVLATLFAGFLAGCTNPAEGLGAEAALKFDGSGNGSHSETAGCGDEGTLGGSGNVNDGVVTIKVSDASGRELFSQEYSGEIKADGTKMTGDSGTWKIEASRHGNDLAGDQFAGDYHFFLNC